MRIAHATTAGGAFMSLEADIVDWVKTRHSWQQVAFVRLCRGETLIDSDVVAIADLLVAGTIEAEPAIKASDIPGPAGSLTPVSLISVGDFANINALPAGEHLTFGPAGVTVVYGHNASGKSGYARLLKAVAAARHREEMGLPPVWLTLGVGGSQAASAVV